MGWFSRKKRARTQAEEAEYQRQQTALYIAQANKYIGAVQRRIVRFSKEFESLLEKTPFENELAELNLVHRDINNYVADLRMLPGIMKRTVAHVAHLMTHANTYTADRRGREKVDADMAQAIRSLDSLGELERDLKNLGKTNKKLLAAVRRLKAKSKQIKGFEKDVRRVYDDYVSASTMSAPQRARGQIDRFKKEAARRPKVLKGVS